MSSLKPTGISTKKILLIALAASILFAAGIAFLNKPILKPEKFWSVAAADQGMFIGYMFKKYNEAQFAKDYVFTVDPNIYVIYNPLELFFLHKTFLLFNKNLPATFYALLLIFSFAYFFSIFIATYYFSESLFVAVVISLFSSAWQYMGFCADVWGISVVQNARSAYYVLPLLILSFLFVVRSIESDDIKKIFASFCTVGIVVWLHPVTGYHWAFVCCFVGLIYDVMMNRRYMVNSLSRVSGILIGSLPTLISVLQNKLFGVGETPLADAAPRQILEASKVINPTYYCHVMPDLLSQYHPLLRSMLIPSMKVLIIASVMMFGYVLYRCRQLINKKGEPLREYKRLFILLYSITSLFFVGFTVLSNPVDVFSIVAGKPISNAIGLLGVLCILCANLFRISREEKPTMVDGILLGFMSVSLLFSVAGSWAINSFLGMIDYPQRIFEQMRGIRIAYLVFLLWSASSVAYFFRSGSFQRTGFFLAAFFIAMTVGFYVTTFNSIHREPSRQEANFYEMASWVHTSTDPDCLTSLLIGDPWQKVLECARFKALAQRSMTFSYDSYQLTYTNQNALIPARKRLEDVTNASATEHGIDAYFAQYNPDYVITTNDRLAMNSARTIVYQNETYAVLQR